jgi:xanthine dehydrogenase accessory factor
MQNADHQVLNQLCNWVSQGDMCWLCTVVKTWGSSPRPIGSLLACNSEGLIVGSLSGGCIEEDLIEKLKAGELASTTPQVLIYGGTSEEAERLGLPCGGQLHVVIEPMHDKRSLPQLNQVVKRLEERQCIERQVDLETGDMVVADLDRFRNLQFSGAADGAKTDGSSAGAGQLVQCHGPRYQLFLIGAGQISRYLADMAQALDYHVIVCDPRQDQLDQWQVEGVQLVSKMPDDAVRDLANDSFTAIIALTHDPRIDDMGLMEALKTDAFFVGALGSTRTSAKRRERLLQLDLTSDQVNRLHGPVGLSIGSKTPAEIAIAILAQLTSLRYEQASKTISA